MKLLDLLVKELPKRGGWPDWCDVVSTNGYGAVWAYKNKGCTSGRELYFNSATEGHVTRAQYEAAIAKNDGWIEWGGGERPVEEGALVDVRFRDGDDDRNIEAIDLLWNHENWSADIIAYRLHKPDINSRANDDRLEQDLNECIGQDVDMPEWNGEGFPPIGCACEMQDSKGTWLPVEIIAKNDGFTFGWSCDYRIVFFGDKADEFRPLRTEAEKAREKLASSLHIAAGASPIELNGIGPLYFKLADAIISGSVFGTTFKAGK